MRVDQSVVSLGRPTSLEMGYRSQETCALKITSVDEVAEDAEADFVLGIRLAQIHCLHWRWIHFL